MGENTNSDDVSESNPKQVANSSAEVEVLDQTLASPNEKPNVNQAEEELNSLRDILNSAVAETKNRASEIAALADHLKEADIESKEKLASLQAVLSDAESIASSLKTVASEASDIPNQLSQLKDEILQIHDTATKTATEVVETHAKVELLQSEATANASAVSRHGQTALKEATAATAQQEAATEAAGSTAKNQAASLAVLVQVQGHLTQAVALGKQVSDALESAKAELVETEAANVSAKQSLEMVKKDEALARQTVEAATQKAAIEEKNIKETGNRVAVLEKTIQATRAELEEHRKEYDTLVQSIESLLPGATSAGLASAFREQKQSYNLPKIGYILLFVASAVLLAFVQPLIPEESWMTKLSNPWEIMLAHTLQKSPVEVPLLLLIYFAFRAFTTADKLQQDYAYKERIATTFEGFKAQFASIDTPPGADSPLAVLCIKLLTIIGQHPARFYDAKHIEDLPSAPQAAKQIQGVFQQSPSNVGTAIQTEEKKFPIPKATAGNVEPDEKV